MILLTFFSDILLFRLQSRSEDISLKVGILEFLVVTVQYQPGLLELFLDLRMVNKDKPEEVWTNIKNSVSLQKLQKNYF